MDLRFALHQLAAQHKLSPDQADRLQKIARSGVEPPALSRSVAFGAAILAAALGGLGVIFWVAANWNSLGRAGKFALLQALVVAMCVGALARPRARVPLGILALLGIGGLFAYFGQTYQTGADPWQLFAWWAALALPLCLGVRHDALWAPWAMVALTAISLWMLARTGQRWEDINPSDLPVHLGGWSAALLLAFAFSPAFSRYTGVGPAAQRVTLLLATSIITVTALPPLFSSTIVPHFGLGLLTLAAAAAFFMQRRFHDTFALSVVGLGLNVLLVALLGRLLFDKGSSNAVGPMLILALAASALLAGTVHVILAHGRRFTNQGGAA